MQPGSLALELLAASAPPRPPSSCDLQSQDTKGQWYLRMLSYADILPTDVLPITVTTSSSMWPHTLLECVPEKQRPGEPAVRCRQDVLRHHNALVE
jgi:hypothetical protein